MNKTLPPLIPSELDSTAPAYPAYISQRNCVAAVGLIPRAFREAVHKHKIPHARLGNQLLVRIEDWHNALARIATLPPNPKEPAPFKTKEELLASWGVRKVR
jgi:hypothetical protein